MFMDDRTVAQIAPSGIFGQNININCNDNPYLTAAMADALCNSSIDQLADDPNQPNTMGINTDADLTTPGQQASVVILRRNIEGGGASGRPPSYRLSRRDWAARRR
jgi:iron complex outermembrane receptor protein